MLEDNYCLDSSIVIDWLRGDKELAFKIQEAQNRVNIFITVITLCELYKGAYYSNRTEKELRIIKDLAESIEILDFSNGACEEFGKEYVRLERTGKQTQESDLMIASIAKTRNLIMITRNKKHFENIDIKIEIW